MFHIEVVKFSLAQMAGAGGLLDTAGAMASRIIVGFYLRAIRIFSLEKNLPLS